MAEPDWLRLQKIIFGKYVQQKLREGGIKREIKAIVDDLKDPHLIIDLISVLSGKTMKKKPKAVTGRIQSIAAMSEAFNFIEECGVDIKKIRAQPEDLVDAKEKTSLALVFQVIIKFIKFEEDGEDSAQLDVRTALELWLKNKTQGYEGISIPSFSKPTWIKALQDGLCFNALIHKMRPNLLDYKALSASDKEGNLNQALDLGEKYLKIEKYLNASDIAKLDETAMIVYLSDWFTGVQLLQKQDIAARRVGKLVDLTILHDKMRADYTEQATAIAAWLDKSEEAMAERKFDDTMAGIKRLLEEFFAYKKGEKSEHIVKQMDARDLFSNLQLRLANHKRPKWTPATEGLAPAALDARFKKLEEAEVERSKALSAELARQTMLAKKYRRFEAVCQRFGTFISSTQAELQSQPSIQSVEDAEDALEALQVTKAGVEHMKSSVLSDLKTLATLLITERFEKQDEVKASLAAQEESADSLNTEIIKTKETLDAALAEQKAIDDALYKAYSEAVTAFQSLIIQKSELLESADEDLEAQLEKVKSLGGEQKDIADALAAVTAADEKVQARELASNPYTTVAPGDTSATAEQFAVQVKKKEALLQSQLAEKKRGGLTEEQVAEINANFEYFDSDKTDTLTKRELRTCLQSLGEESTPQDVQSIFDKYDEAKKGALSRPEFMQFMKDNAGDTDSKEEIIKSFKYLSYDKDVILEEELANLINERTWKKSHVDYLKKEMASKDSGFDFPVWTDAAFAR